MDGQQAGRLMAAVFVMVFGCFFWPRKKCCLDKFIVFAVDVWPHCNVSFEQFYGTLLF